MNRIPTFFIVSLILFVSACSSIEVQKSRIVDVLPYSQFFVVCKNEFHLTGYKKINDKAIPDGYHLWSLDLLRSSDLKPVQKIELGKDKSIQNIQLKNDQVIFTNFAGEVIEKKYLSDLFKELKSDKPIPFTKMNGDSLDLNQMTYYLTNGIICFDLEVIKEATEQYMDITTKFFQRKVKINQKKRSCVDSIQGVFYLFRFPNNDTIPLYLCQVKNLISVGRLYQNKTTILDEKADLGSGKSKNYLLKDSFLYYFNEKNILQLNSSLVITNRLSVEDKIH
jgi:hypothetical protein